MSRSVLQKEAETNPSVENQVCFKYYFARFPASGGSSVNFEVYRDEDYGHVRVRIVSTWPDGFSVPTGHFALASVPVIKQYLHETGALKLLYEGIKADTLAELERVREQLGVTEPIARQVTPESLKQLNEGWRNEQRKHPSNWAAAGTFYEYFSEALFEERTDEQKHLAEGSGD